MDYRLPDGSVCPKKLRVCRDALAGMEPAERLRWTARFDALERSRDALERPQMRTSGEAHVEIDMFGRIGEDWFEEGITAASVMRAMRAQPGKTVKIRLNSGGGDAFEGDAIRSVLASAGRRVEIEIVALAASAASVIAMGASPGALSIAENGVLMIHDASVGTMGGVKEHQSAIQLLNAVDEGAAAIYARRASRAQPEMRALMAAETWLTASEALGLGLVDKIVPGLSAQQYAESVPAAVLQRLGSGKKEPRDNPAAMELAAIAKRLGLPETATEADVVAALDKAVAKPEPKQEPVAAPSLNAADVAKIVADTLATRDAAANASAAPAQVEQLHAAACTAAVERFISAGKVHPAGRDNAIKACGTNAAQLAAAVTYWENAPKVVGSPEQFTPPEKVNQLTKQQRQMCADANISEKDFLETLAKKESK